MYRIGFIFVMVLAIASGVLAGVLNPEVVDVDLLWLQLAWPLGLTLICVLVLGVLLGLLLISIFVVWPLQMRLRKAEKLADKNALTVANLVDQQDA